VTAKGRLRLRGIITSVDSLKILDRGMKRPINNKIFMPEGTNGLIRIIIIKALRNIFK